MTERPHSETVAILQAKTDELLAFIRHVQLSGDAPAARAAAVAATNFETGLMWALKALHS